MNVKLVLFLRVLFGLGDAASYSAVLGMVLSLFPSRAATMLGMCETAFGLGYTIGDLAKKKQITLIQTIF